MIHTCASNNNPSSKELANCPGFNFNTRVWIYNHFSWLFRPPMKYVPEEVALFRFCWSKLLCYKVLCCWRCIVCKGRARSKYFKLTAIEHCPVSHQLPGGTINWSWTEREPSIIYLSNCSIYSSRKAINVFSTVHYSFSMLHGNNTWLIMEKNHMESLNLVTPAKLFCFKPGTGLEIICWSIQTDTYTTTLIFGFIIVCTVHIIVTISMLLIYSRGIKTTDGLKTVWINTITYL